MLTVVTALVPVFLVIATGWGMRISGIVSDDQWIGFERLTYYLVRGGVVRIAASASASRARG